MILRAPTASQPNIESLKDYQRRSLSTPDKLRPLSCNIKRLLSGIVRYPPYPKPTASLS